MSQTIITARIYDQTVQLANLPLVASGSQGVLQIRCEFGSEWSGYGKAAVFYRDPKEVYHVPLADNTATVPHEVLASEGFFWFGIMGTADNTRTTEAVRINVAQGALTVATASPEEPTPNIYQQLLAAQGATEARLDEVVAMRGEAANTHTLSDEYINGTIKTNGASAYIRFNITKMSLVAGGNHYSDYCILPALAPLGPVYLESSNPDIDVTIDESRSSGWARILIENVGNTKLTTDMTTTVEAYYPLASLYFAELADARAGYDGTTYNTAGTAIRSQVGAAMQYINNRLDTAVIVTDVVLPAAKWVGSGNLYSQVVSLNGVTERSQVNLTPSVEQLVVFYQKDITFVTENYGGVITVYVIGQKPQNDYTIQADIMEVSI